LNDFATFADPRNANVGAADQHCQQNESPARGPGLSSPVRTGTYLRAKLASFRFDCRAAVGLAPQPAVALRTQSPGRLPGGVFSMRKLPVLRFHQPLAGSAVFRPDFYGAVRPRRGRKNTPPNGWPSQRERNPVPVRFARPFENLAHTERCALSLSLAERI
jgi:hypothetical protein